MEREPIQRTKASFVEQGEALGLNDVFTAQQRANEQVFYMDSFRLNKLTGQFEPALGEFQHQLGPFPDLVGYTFKRGRELIYVSYHSSEETKFRFGDKTVRPDKGFLAISYVGPVVKDNSFVERFVVRVDCLTEQQAQNVVYEMKACEEAEGWYRGSGVTSFSKDFDPFGHEVFLAQAIKKVVGEENLNSQHKELIQAIEGQANARLKTHSAEKNQHMIEPVFLRTLGKYAVFDSVLNRYVLWEETTSDVNSLAYIYEAQRLTAAYLKDPNPNKAPLVVNFAVALSARTAGFRKDPSAAASRLEVDKNGVAKQITDIKNLADVDPRFFLGPVSNWTLEMPDNPSPVLPTSPEFPYPVYPITPGGGTTGFYGDVIRSIPAPLGISNTTTENVGATVIEMAFVAPAIVDVGLFTASSVSQVITTVDGIRSIENNQNIEYYQDIWVAEDQPQTGFASDENMGMVADDDIYFDEPTIINDFPYTPVEPVSEPTGGGGLVLPREIKTTVWDKRMKDRFRQAREPKTVFADQVLPQKVKQEQVIFDASKKEEFKFKEYASDLEVLSVKPVVNINTKVFEQESSAQLLLANSLDKTTQVESCDKNLHVHEFVTDNNKKHNNSNDEVVNSNHYDTAQYHSKEESTDEIPDQTNEVAPIVQEQAKDEQSYKFFIPNALLTNYLLWRKIKNRAQEIGINIDVKQGENNQEIVNNKKADDGAAEDSIMPDTSFAQKAEQHKTQAKKVKVKTRKASPAFLSLLLLTKIKLLTKVKLLARKNNLAGFKQLFATDTLLLFLLNPKLFLVNESVILGSNSDSRIDSGQARMT